MLNCVHSDSSIWNHVIILISLFLIHVIFNFCFVLSRSLAWGKQEFKFGGVMNILNTHFIPIL